MRYGLRVPWNLLTIKAAELCLPAMSTPAVHNPTAVGTYVLPLPLFAAPATTADVFAASCVSELKADGVDTAHIMRAAGAPSPFTYIIVDRAGTADIAKGGGRGSRGLGAKAGAVRKCHGRGRHSSLWGAVRGASGTVHSPTSLSGLHALGQAVGAAGCRSSSPYPHTPGSLQVAPAPASTLRGRR